MPATEQCLVSDYFNVLSHGDAKDNRAVFPNSTQYEEIVSMRRFMMIAALLGCVMAIGPSRAKADHRYGGSNFGFSVSYGNGFGGGYGRPYGGGYGYRGGYGGFPVYRPVPVYSVPVYSVPVYSAPVYNVGFGGYGGYGGHHGRRHCR